MFWRNPFGFLFCMMTLHLLGALLFMAGFFSFSHNVMQNEQNITINSRPMLIDDVKISPPSRKYQKVVLLLIDALRRDFVNSTNMPFSTKTVCSLVDLRVGVPTVTMPRIKSLTTGTLSNFMDIVFNLDRATQLDDSLLHRMNMRGDVLVFAGDSTWSKLFPTEFNRFSANVDSFFVNDFDEGDTALTAAVFKELQQDDWNMLILHYLGLDHIGHVEGSTSIKIPKKLLEMDNIVKTIRTSKHGNDSLLLVTGDHGMRDGGGHGGGTPEEVWVPLLVFDKNCTKKSERKSEYEQIDLVPTLSVLLSLEIPHSSIGCLISELLDKLSYEDQLYAYFYNAYHLIHYAGRKFGERTVTQNVYYKWYTMAQESHKFFLNTQRNRNITSTYLFEEAKLNYIRLASEISKNLAASLLKFDANAIVLGLVLTTSAIFNVLIFAFLTDSKYQAEKLWNSKLACTCIFASLVFTTFCQIMKYTGITSITYFCIFTLLIGACLYVCIDIAKKWLRILLHIPQKMRLTLAVPLPLSLVVCISFYILTLGSSSFIEEEHQIWNYFVPSILLILFFRCFHYTICKSLSNAIKTLEIVQSGFGEMRMPLLMLVILALLRPLNHCGNKPSDIMIIADILNETKNVIYLSLFLLLGLVALLIKVRHITTPFQMIACVLASFSIYCYHAARGVVVFIPIRQFSVIIVPFFWCNIAFIAISSYGKINKRSQINNQLKVDLVNLLQTNLVCSLLIAALLQKPHNVILLPTIIFVLEQAYKLCDHLQPPIKDQRYYVLVYKTLLTLYVGKMFYFLQGNTNSLATIDITPGYVGLSTYNPFIAFTFVTLSMYASNINAFLFLITHVFQIHKSNLVQYDKLRISNSLLVYTSNSHLELIMFLYAAVTLLPATIYLYFLIALRFHLFIYSVFAPKAFYEIFSVILFYVKFLVTYLYLRLLKNDKLF